MHAFVPLFLAATALFQTPPLSTAFIHVRVIPMDTDQILDDHTVLIENGRIARIGPSKDIPIPSGTRTIDGRNERYLMPGLCDSHVHVLEPDEFALYVVNGVTTVRNMSGEPFHLDWRRAIADERMFGPTLVTTGPTIDSVPPDGSNRAIVRTRDEAELAVELMHADGYDLLKVYSGLTPDAFDGVMRASKRLQMQVVGHLARPVGLERALAAGQASIDHAEEYLYTYFANAGPEKIPDAVRITRDAGASVVPTLVAFDTIRAQVADVAAMSKRPELRFVDPAQVARWQRKDTGYQRTFAPSDAARLASSLAFQKALVRALHEGGVPLLAGTDAGVAFGVSFVLPGFALHEELANLRACGLSPFETLRTATSNAARFLRREKEFGTVTVGSRADLVLLEKNPLEDVAHASRIAGVMLRGRWLPKEELGALREALAALYRDEARFVSELRAEGPSKASERFLDARERNPATRWFRESALNALGYEWLAAERVEDAVVAFELCVEAYPLSASAHDSLGEGYARAGRVADAIASYERSLALDPSNTNAKTCLAQLRAR